jgi:uncharacterized repeat protein (TIGR03803 family)
LAMRESHRIIKHSSAALTLLVLGVLLGAAWAQTESVPYSFCAQYKNGICTDGASPYTAGVVIDQNGNLYGTTYSGGAYNGCGLSTGCGAVFKLTPEGEETVLYSFCAQANCTDGYSPRAGVVLDRKGNLYGTTYGGGAHDGCGFGGCGAVFKLTPEGKETVLYSFCAQGGHYCTDGVFPNGLLFDQDGNLYGTTISGGVYGGGVVFKLTPKSTETVLYSFCAAAACTDGRYPYAGLVLDGKGNLYGTTIWGGVYYGCGGDFGCGVVFKLTPTGKETVLHSFCAQLNCTDGAFPLAAPILDEKDNLYGTNSGFGAGGGLNCPGCGVVFKLAPNGKYTVLHSFCATINCTDGEYPMAGLVLDQKGNLYGTTFYGGAHGSNVVGGVVFMVTPTGKETVLYSFCAQTNCADGTNPTAGLVLDKKGDLYGTTYEGGHYHCVDAFEGGCGVVFKLTPLIARP